MFFQMLTLVTINVSNWNRSRHIRINLFFSRRKNNWCGGNANNDWWKKKLEKIISNFISTEIEWVALNNANVEKDKHDTVIEFLETLEEDDDVQNVFSNANFGNN